ncbi:MAG: hypothetical protein KDH96_00770 [Candidatus Riesia sp.]|nr:hypothetical protein [Candidatus Riesia sp.]
MINQNRVDGQRISARSVTPKSGVVSASGDNILITAPGAGMHIILYAWSWWNNTSTETTVVLKSTTMDNMDSYTTEAKGGGKIMDLPAGLKVDLPDNEPLLLELSGANEHGYFILYEVVEANNYNPKINYNRW